MKILQAARAGAYAQFSKSDYTMFTFRIETREQGWALYRARSVRPSVCADSLAELIELAKPLLLKHGSMVRIKGPGGGFQELRFEKKAED